MSYRAFKRLLGETSLERKCHFLFGGFMLLLITASFWLFARQTENLAYEQITTASRLLVVQIVDQQVATKCRSSESGAAGTQEQAQVSKAFNQLRLQWEESWPQAIKKYNFVVIKGWASRPDQVPDLASWQQLKKFRDDPTKQEENELLHKQSQNVYYGAVRASESCINCHKKTQPDLAEKDLLAVVRVVIDTQPIEDGFHINRAFLLSAALITALLIMGGSYVIVRYVIVKPIKHLKEVSDAISAGELNVRSEIQTGDEFEDLSHAFNRMLRNLVAMQDRLRKVNNDLDRKVDELAQANLALYESNRLKGDFLARISHELRTPLNSIVGFSEVLQSASGLTEKQQRWVGNIRTSGEQLTNLISDILDLAKIEAGKMHVSVSQFEVVDACEGVLTMFRQLAEKKNIDLRGVYASGMPKLRQDVVKMQQILNNLVSNAIKFTPEGGRILLKGSVEGSQVVLVVQDTGVGIAPEDQELVFEKFRQAGNIMTREHGGTGLGLSIVRELSKLLGGEVSLHSELGRGSTFTVRLPVALSEEPRLEMTLAHEGIDLTKAQRIDVRLYMGSHNVGVDPPAEPMSGLPPAG